MFTRFIRHVAFYRSVYVFKKLTIFRSLFGLVAPLVSALVLETPVNVVSGVPFNLTWTTTAGDPYANQTSTFSPFLPYF